MHGFVFANEVEEGMKIAQQPKDLVEVYLLREFFHIWRFPMPVGSVQLGLPNPPSA